MRQDSPGVLEFNTTVPYNVVVRFSQAPCLCRVAFKKKRQIGFTANKTIADWMDQQVGPDREFKPRSEAIEKALHLLRLESETGGTQGKD